MIVIMKPMTEQKEIDKLAESLTAQGVEVNPVYGTDLTILGLVGDTSKIDPSRIEANRNVERVVHVAEPFKRQIGCFIPDDTVLDIAGARWAAKADDGGRPLLGGIGGADHGDRQGSAKAALGFCAAARSSRVPRPTRFRA